MASVTKISCATSQRPVPTHSFSLLLIDMSSIFITRILSPSKTMDRNETLMGKPLEEPGPRLSNISLHRPGMRRLAWWHAVGFFHQPGHKAMGNNGDLEGKTSRDLLSKWCRVHGAPMLIRNCDMYHYFGQDTWYTPPQIYSQSLLIRVWHYILACAKSCLSSSILVIRGFILELDGPPFNSAPERVSSFSRDDPVPGCVRLSLAYRKSTTHLFRRGHCPHLSTWRSIEFQRL